MPYEEFSIVSRRVKIINNYHSLSSAASLPKKNTTDYYAVLTTIDFT